MVAVGCRAEIDDETEVRLGWDREVDPGAKEAYSGTLKTPTGVVSVRTVLDAEVLVLMVNRTEVGIRVWVNDDHEPDLVIVGVS